MTRSFSKLAAFIFIFFNISNNAIIAAGVTPEILDAAPRVGGLIFDSFSTTSFDKLPTNL